MAKSLLEMFREASRRPVPYEGLTILEHNRVKTNSQRPARMATDTPCTEDLANHVRPAVKKQSTRR